MTSLCDFNGGDRRQMAVRAADVMKHKTVLLAVGLVVLIGIVVGGVAGAHPINRQLHAWKLLPEPERLTELYFTHSTSLPATYTPGDTETVAFTVHNLEYRTVTYHYNIVQISQSNSQKLPLASGTFTLRQNHYANKSVTVTLGDLSRSQVSIQLSPVSETIDYWVNKG